MTTRSKMKFQDIKWPMYAIRQHTEIKVENQVTYVHSAFGVRILDNKNLGGTFANRRITTATLKGLPIYQLKEVVFTLADIIASKRKVFVDATGELYTYNKTTFCIVEYYRVTNVEIKGTRTILQVEGIFTPVILPYIQKVSLPYIGLLKWKGDYIVYEFSLEKKKTVRRKL